MKTCSIMVQTLCVPCCNRCRYCLLSWDGKLPGAEYERSEAYAAAFHAWLRQNRPDLSFGFSFGYSMEHPALFRAIDFMRSIGSPGGKFLQMEPLTLCPIDIAPIDVDMLLPEEKEWLNSCPST